jgi:hypothetical protein
MSGVFDTDVAIDYLRGFEPAARAFRRFPHPAITVASWVEIMAEAPAELAAETREFLRSFERLAINEAISDRALGLIERHPGLALRYAIPWATALANQLVYVTCDLPQPLVDKTVWIPYRKGSRSGP